MDINKNTTLLEALEMAHEGHSIFDSLERLILNTGLSTEELNEILKPYSESILSGNGLSDDEIKEIMAKLLK